MSTDPTPVEQLGGLITRASPFDAAEDIIAAGWVSPEQHRAEVDRLTIEAREDTATRVERWARGHFGFLPLGLITALAEPVRDHVAEAAALRKQVQG